MSLSPTAFVELVIPGSRLVWCVAQVYLESTVDTHALLCWPWGEYDGEGDPPPPVVKPRGIPADLGNIPLHDYALLVHEDGAKKKERGCITAAYAKKHKLKPVPNHEGYFVDPDIKVATWLSTQEIAEVARRLRKMRRKRDAKTEPWYEVEGLHAMMQMMERTHYVQDTKARFVLWFR